MSIIKQTLVLCLFSWFTVVSLSYAQPAEPVKVGFIFVMSGRYANLGALAKQGAQLAVQQLNESGGILGRKIVAIYADSEGDPAVAQTKFAKMALEDNVDVIVGSSLNETAKAMSTMANDLAVPLIIPVAMAPELTGKDCNRYTFRVGQNLDQNLRSAVRVASTKKGRKWAVIGYNTTYGREASQLFQKYLLAVDSKATFVPTSLVSLAPEGTSNWSSWISNLTKAKPEGVLVTLFGTDLAEFIRQATSLGFFTKGYDVLMNLGGSTEVLFAVKYVLPDGVWLGTPYWFQVDRGMIGHKFSAAYRGRFKFAPSWPAAEGYAAVLTYAEAVRAAGSTDKAKVITALEGLSLELPVGLVTIRPEDHQAVVPAFWGRALTDHAYRVKVLSDIRIIEGIDITQPSAKTDCRMQR